MRSFGASFCSLQKEACLADVEIVPLVKRRRKWTDAEKELLRILRTLKGTM